MRERAITPVHVALLVLGLVLVTACGHGHGHHDDGYNYVVYHETEPNDYAWEADDFGTLYPDDYFGIAGEVYDDGFFLDDIDGFAFRAADPLVVAFHVWVDDVWSEVRVGLYDPAIDETVAYWYQDDGYVYGELDVYHAGADFHLFVELLYGDTTYELEIEAFHAYAASAEGTGSPALLAPGDAERRLAPREATSLTEDERDDAARYGRRPTAATAPGEPLDAIVGTARLFVLDEETGELSRDSFLITAGGSWMGMPGTALVE